MKRKLASRPVADPLQVFNHACRFLATDQALRRVFGGSDWALTIAPPTMVLSAFASELFLKCLLILETSEAPLRPQVLPWRYSRRTLGVLFDAPSRTGWLTIERNRRLPTDVRNAEPGFSSFAPAPLATQAPAASKPGAFFAPPPWSARSSSRSPM